MVRMSALEGLRGLLALWDLDAEQCLAPVLAWLLPGLYGLFGDLEEMETRQQASFSRCWGSRENLETRMEALFLREVLVEVVARDEDCLIYQGFGLLSWTKVMSTAWCNRLPRNALPPLEAVRSY